MKFKQGTRRKAIEYEKDLVKQWKKNQTFEKSVEMRPTDNAFVFYDGPPFITGVPHHGTLLTSIVKDAVPRYWTMKGKRVERVWGWDCHGLPAEVFTEKKLGIKDRRDIGTKVSLEEYVTTCRANMVQTGSEWEDTIDRIGRWVDFKGAYKTMDKNYMESVWWAFKKLYEAGKIYEGEKVLLYCTRDATPISKAEVAMDNSYQDVTDPSVYVKFKLKKSLVKDGPTYMLAWTTTPWTLAANTALAVNEEHTYQLVQYQDEHFVIDAALGVSSRVFTKKDGIEPDFVKIIQPEIKGEELVGLEYEPLFGVERKGNAHKIWHADYVSSEEGTGIVHLAPAYGEEDFALAQQYKIPVVHVIDENGFYTEGHWKGQNVWEANKPIAKELHEQGIVWKIDYIRHSYPHCHRCHNRLMYRAHPSWFMDIDGQREAMLEQNGQINWFPEHIKNGRSAKTIQSAPDWNLSRDRFWATAMPVWKGIDKAGKEHVKVIGSYAELKEFSGVELDDYHRPWIDDVTFKLDGVTYKRIDKVLDCWFESGSMPFAQFHYPFENVEKFERNFPGDFIVEYVPQVRAWFYYLQAVNVGLFEAAAFKNALVHGTLAGNDGRKMSKSFGNYTDPNELMDEYSADALRMLFLTSSLLNGEDFSLQDKDVADVNRKLAMVWNMYDFFTLYADVDGWEWNDTFEDPSDELTNSLDIWIVSRVHQLTAEVDEHMQHYDIPNAAKPIIEFIEDASNWYVRRSRKRFWKSEDDADKRRAYQTLHYALVRLSMVMAPFTPFLAEELFQKLTGGESVHLLDWPEAGHVNELSLQEMAEVRELITRGLAQRAGAGIKVRQPLASAKVVLPFNITNPKREELRNIMAEELNVKALTCTLGKASKITLDLELNDGLRKEGMMRELVRHIQNMRKDVGLNVDDRIGVVLETDDVDVMDMINLFKAEIYHEVLAVGDRADTEGAHSKHLKLDGHEMRVVIQKV